MAAAAAVCCAAIWIVAGRSNWLGVLLGMAGPLAAATGSWAIVERVHRRAPGRVPGAMIKLFAAKMILFGAYVAAVVVLLPAGHVAFVVSFTCQYVLLHAMEAVYLRRLFSPGARRWSVG